MDEAPATQNPLEWRQFVLRWMGIALAFHLIAAFFSVGHHSVDEYFQILEFLSFKRGVTPAHDLAVEYQERMRPWLQPFLYLQLVHAWEWLGVHNPFTWAWSMRLATGLLGWAGTYGLALRSRDWFRDPRAQRFCVMALALIWFFPALHVRPSSESLGGSAFVAGLVLLVSPGALARSAAGLAACALGGMLLGLSFEARFQMGLMIVGLVAWLAFVGKMRWYKLALVLAGAGFVFAIGRWVDRWGYGEWVLSPWRYVQYNLLRGEVNRYGQAPVWDVFRMAFTESWPFLGLGLAIATLVAWYRHPRHVLTWCQLPFFLVHEAIAHKELRFFFPIALAGPVLLTLSLTSGRTGEFLDPMDAAAGWLGALVRGFWRFLLLNDAVALLRAALAPLLRGPCSFMSRYGSSCPPAPRALRSSTTARIRTGCWATPSTSTGCLALVTTPFGSYGELEPRLMDKRETLWVFEPGLKLPPEAANIARYCRPAIQSLPPWITRLDFNGWLARAHPWTLFRCASEQAPDQSAVALAPAGARR